MSRTNYTEDELAIRALLGTYRDAEEESDRFVKCPFLELLITKGEQAMIYLWKVLDELSKRREAARKEKISKKYNIDIEELDELTMRVIRVAESGSSAVLRRLIFLPIAFIASVGLIVAAWKMCLFMKM